MVLTAVHALPTEVLVSKRHAHNCTPPEEQLSLCMFTVYSSCTLSSCILSCMLSLDVQVC